VHSVTESAQWLHEALQHISLITAMKCKKLIHLPVAIAIKNTLNYNYHIVITITNIFLPDYNFLQNYRFTLIITLNAPDSFYKYRVRLFGNLQLRALQ